MTFTEYPYNNLRKRFGALLSDHGFDLMNKCVHPGPRLPAPARWCAPPPGPRPTVPAYPSRAWQWARNCRLLPGS